MLFMKLGRRLSGSITRIPRSYLRLESFAASKRPSLPCQPSYPIRLLPRQRGTRRERNAVPAPNNGRVWHAFAAGRRRVTSRTMRPGYAHDHGARRNPAFFRDERTGRDEALGADLTIGQQHRAHADERIAADERPCSTAR